MHLVGFIIRIYHDARSPERHIYHDARSPERHICHDAGHLNVTFITMHGHLNVTFITMHGHLNVALKHVGLLSILCCAFVSMDNKPYKMHGTVHTLR